MDSHAAEAMEPHTTDEIVKEEIASVSTTHNEVAEEQEEDKVEKGPASTVASKPANNLGFPASGLPKLKPQDLALDKILYYFRHPDETPPHTIKNMVKLLQLMKEDEENPKEDESSDIFYSSDESVEDSSYDEDVEEGVDSDKVLCMNKSPTSFGRNNMISLTKHGLRFPNGYFSNRFLQDMEAVVVVPAGSGHCLRVILRYRDDDVNVSLPLEFDANTILTALEQWISIYKKTSR